MISRGRKDVRGICVWYDTWGILKTETCSTHGRRGLLESHGIDDSSSSKCSLRLRSTESARHSLTARATGNRRMSVLGSRHGGPRSKDETNERRSRPDKFVSTSGPTISDSRPFSPKCLLTSSRVKLPSTRHTQLAVLGTCRRWNQHQKQQPPPKTHSYHRRHHGQTFRKADKKCFWPQLRS